MAEIPVKNQSIVSPTEWLEARQRLLVKEKEFTRLRDQLSRQRQELPWVKVEKEYVFDSPKGKETLRRVKTDISDREGASVFYRDEYGNVFHTYSSFSRGIDMLNTAYHYLDLVPKGRDEDGLEFTQAWVRHHDKYEN